MIGKLIALVTVLAGLLFLTAAAAVLFDPSYTQRLDLAPDVWIKASVLGGVLLCIGMVAMAGARHDER